MSRRLALALAAALALGAAPAHAASAADSLLSLLAEIHVGAPLPGALPLRVRAWQAFEGSSDETQPFEYWARATRADAAGGLLDAWTYILADGHETLGRVRWTSVSLDTADMRALEARILSALAGEFTKRPHMPRPALEPLSYASDAEDLRESATAVLFVQRSARQLTVDLVSRALLAQLDQLSPDDDRDAEMAHADTLTRRALAVALHARHRAFAAALAEPRPEHDQAALVRAALLTPLTAANVREHDLLWRAADRWLRDVAIPDSPLDSLAVQRLRAWLAPLTLPLVRTPHEGWCCGTMWRDSLASAAGRSRWADDAFLEELEGGFMSPCVACETNPDWGNNQWVPVIAHAEVFLARLPRSPIASRVKRILAEAHETAWSLANVRREGETLPDFAPHLGEAEEHRKAALALYDELLRTAPALIDRATRARLRRMRLGVDTNDHRFYCFLWP